jgi:hypothetical protein
MKFMLVQHLDNHELMSRKPYDSVDTTLDMHVGLIALHHRTLQYGDILTRHASIRASKNMFLAAAVRANGPSGTLRALFRNKYQPITSSHTSVLPSASDTCSFAALTSSE